MRFAVVFLVFAVSGTLARPQGNPGAGVHMGGLDDTGNIFMGDGLENPAGGIEIGGGFENPDGSIVIGGHGIRGGADGKKKE